jgi:amidophosphoribosyltransferase
MCGVFGIFGHPKAKELTFRGLLALQHRGKSAAGMASLDLSLGEIQIHRDLGKVREILNPEFPIMKRLTGQAYIGHVRYPTAGSDSYRNVQPHQTSSTKGTLAFVSNGDVVNLREQVEFLRRERIKVRTQNDAEMIAASINWQVTIKGRDIIASIRKIMKHVQGSYAGLLLSEFDGKLFAFRDPYGIRPLVYGEIDGYPVFASETCALDFVRARFIREVSPGEIIAVGENGIESFQGTECQRLAFCVFELIYFARPDSLFTGRSYQAIRERMGEVLAQEHPADADMIIAIPKSGIPGAVGFARASKIPFGVGMIDNPTLSAEIDRTFIGSSPEQRDEETDLKQCILRDIVAGKSVVVMDDSIVRGITTQKVIRSLREAGTRAIHVRIPSPPYKFPCYYGIETKERRTLVAREGDIKLVSERRIGNPTSLAYLSYEGMFKAIGEPSTNFCTACLNGDYPIPVPQENGYFKL